MGRFNLLDEPWIVVFQNESGEKKEVSMLELFQHAAEYRTLAGEMETQNFAVLRFLLAVVQTVFSRFDWQGTPLPGINLNADFVQTEPVNGDDLENYSEEAACSWEQLYRAGSFPAILFAYLEKWRDHFYLFDEQHPFFQVTRKEMDDIMAAIPKKSQPTSIFGKNLNRTISESENKTALFSPVTGHGREKRSEKDILTEAELARWLLAFHGYTGLADKVSVTTEGQRPSKGWLFDLGGIYLQGDSIFETLLLNYLPESPTDSEDFCGRIQQPCWEISGEKAVKRLCLGSFIDNLSELYTNWSRAVYIDPSSDLSKPLEIKAVKLPEIDHSENSIEPMTLWRKNESGPNKNRCTPRKHSAGQALWRSFGIIALKSSKEGVRQPGIFAQYQRLAKAAGSRWTDLIGVSMADDGNATSWLPVDEISDSFQINDLIMTDEQPDGWVVRINEAIENTKQIVSGIFRGYLRGICEVRNLKVTPPMDPAAAGFMERETAEMYAEIDGAFKEWLASIEPGDSKEEKIISWDTQIRKMVLRRGETLFENSTGRDLTGIDTEAGTENIATIYWKFLQRMNHRAGKGGQS